MSFTKEQSEQIKKQLIEQIEKQDLPNKEEIIEHLSALDEKEVEQFLKDNKIGTGLAGESSEKGSDCIFCSIARGKIPSYKLTENKKAIAVLDINPLSKGNSIVIPFEHLAVEKLPKPLMTLAQKLAKKIKTKLKPEEIKIETSSVQGHAVVNIIPVYKNTPLARKPEKEEELKKIKSRLEIKKRSQKPKKAEDKKEGEGFSNLPKLSFRIP